MCLQLAHMFAVPAFADRTIDNSDEDHGYPCQYVLPHRTFISSMAQPTCETGKKDSSAMDAQAISVDMFALPRVDTPPVSQQPLLPNQAIRHQASLWEAQASQ